MCTYHTTSYCHFSSLFLFCVLSSWCFNFSFKFAINGEKGTIRSLCYNNLVTILLYCLTLYFIEFPLPFIDTLSLISCLLSEAWIKKPKRVITKIRKVMMRIRALIAVLCLQVLVMAPPVTGDHHHPHPLAPLSNVGLQIICENPLLFMRAATQEVRILAPAFSATCQIMVVFTPNRSQQIIAAFFAALFATAFLSIMIASVVSS